MLPYEPRLSDDNDDDGIGFALSALQSNQDCDECDDGISCAVSALVFKPRFVSKERRMEYVRSCKHSKSQVRQHVLKQVSLPSAIGFGTDFSDQEKTTT